MDIDDRSPDILKWISGMNKKLSEWLPLFKNLIIYLIYNYLFIFNESSFDRNYVCQHFEIYFLIPCRFVNILIPFVTHPELLFPRMY